jgi:NPCBM/NEW2 domain/FecR protein
MDHAVSLSSPIRDPQRGLVCFIATFAESWSSVLRIRAQVIKQLGTRLTTEAVGISAAIPILEEHLSQAAEEAINNHDVLAHIIIQHALAHLRSLTIPDNRCADHVLARMSKAIAEGNKLLHLYYHEGFAASGLSDSLAISEQEIPAHLCHARSLIDWHKEPGEWVVSAHEHELTAVIQRYVTQDYDEVELPRFSLLVQKNVKTLAYFERQLRIHLISKALYAELSHSVSDRLLTARVNKNARSSRSSSKTTTPAHHFPEYEQRQKTTMTIVISALFVIIGLVIIMWSQKSAPREMSKQLEQAIDDIEIISVSGTVLALTPALQNGPRQEVPVNKGQRLKLGHGLISKENSRVIGELPAGIRLEMHEQSQITVLSKEQGHITLQLSAGRLALTDRRGSLSDGVQLRTPDAEVMLTGGQAQVSYVDGYTTVICDSGQLSLAGKNKPGMVTVLPGRRAQIFPERGPVVFREAQHLRGINLGGGDITMENRRWFSEKKALNAGLSLQTASGTLTYQSESVADKNTDKNGNDEHVFSGGISAQDGLRMKQIVPNGLLETTLWLKSTEPIRPEQLTLKMGARQTRVKISALGKNTWRLEPLIHIVDNRRLELEISGPVVVCGMLIQALDEVKDTMPPVVTLRDAPEKIRLYLRQELPLEASVDGEIAQINRIDYVIGGTVVASSTRAPFRAKWSAEKPGSYQLIIRTIDNQNNVHDAQPISVLVYAAFGTGEITREIWNNIPGPRLNSALRIDLRTRAADLKDTISGFAAQSKNENYVLRLSGYLHLPLTGNYQFLITGDDDAELFLALPLAVAGQREDGVVRVAYVEGEEQGLGRNEWDRRPTQKSQAYFFNGDSRVFFEAWLKQGIGHNHIQVGWIMPDGESETPISAVHGSASYRTLSRKEPPLAIPLTPSPQAKFVKGINLAGPDVVINQQPWNGSQQVFAESTSENVVLVPLSECMWEFAQNELGPIEKNRSNGRWKEKDGGLLAIGSRTFTHGLGMMAPARAVYRVDGLYDRFQAWVGVNVSGGMSSSVQFRVLGDGRDIFNSGIMKLGMEPQFIDVPIKPYRELSLVVEDAGDGNSVDFADWGDAVLERSAPHMVHAGKAIKCNNTLESSLSAPIKTMLQTGLAADERGLDMSFQLPNGIYYMYVWNQEHLSSAMDFALTVSGNQTPFAIKKLANNNWQRSEPIPARVTDGFLRLSVPSAMGRAQLMGLEIWSDNEASVATKPVTELKPAAQEFSVSVIDAKLNKKVEKFSPLKDGDTLVISQLPSPLINLEFHLPDHVQSIKFTLPKCSLNASGTEVARPFGLGDNRGRFHSWEVPPGKYHLTVVGFSDKTALTQVGTWEIRFTVVP